MLVYVFLFPAYPEGPRIEKIQSREAILKKSSFQYRMKFSIENDFFIPSPSLAAEKQGPGLKFSSGNENFKLRMKNSSENGSFVRGGMFFVFVFVPSSENNFFRSLGPLGSDSRGPAIFWVSCVLRFCAAKARITSFGTTCALSGVSRSCETHYHCGHPKHLFRLLLASKVILIFL